MSDSTARNRPPAGGLTFLNPAGWPQPRGYSNGIKARGEMVFVGGMVGWDANEKFAAKAGKAWLVPALGAWVAVGLLAEWRGRIAIPVDKEIAADVAAPAPEGGA